MLYHVRLITYYMNPHPALWAPLSQAWERGRGRGMDIVTVYTDMILYTMLKTGLMATSTIQIMLYRL